MTTIQDFNAFQDVIQGYYQNGDYETALDLLTECGDDYPEYHHLIYFWKITLAARSGDNTQSLEYLREILSTGFWYEETFLRANPALEEFQGFPPFEELLSINRELRQRDAERIFPMLTLRSEGRCQKGDDPCPTLIGLHANASTARDGLRYWQPAAPAGWLVAAVQSEQALWKEAYIWDNRQRAEEQLRARLSSLEEGYSIDKDRIVMGGLSTGADLAMWLTIRRKISACGFIAIAPDGPYIEALQNLEKVSFEIEDHPPRGYFIIGAKDNTIHQESIEIVVSLLNQAGVACKLEILPNVDHEYAIEYRENLLRALAFLAE